MPTQPLNPDSQGLVTFRKSIYDDDADSLTLDAVEVVQTNLTEHDPPQTPSWLSYTTSTEKTAEGPEGNRTYLHLDFSIDTDSLGDNDTYFIRIAASDGPNEATQTFRFMKGDLQLDTITGCVLWMKPEKESPRPAEGDAYSSPTNFGTGGNLTATQSETYHRDLAMGKDGVEMGNEITHNGPIFSTTDSQQPHSFFVVRTQNSDLSIYICSQEGGTNDFEFRATYRGLSVKKYYPGGLIEDIAPDSIADDAFALYEVHKRPDGSTYVFENGVQIMSITDDKVFSGGDFTFESFDGGSEYVLEAVAFVADLTNAQVEAIRKRLFQSYPKINMQALAATEFS